jgi:hypothetical protein
MPNINTRKKQLLIWIPDGMAQDDKTREIAETMKSQFKVGEINKDDYEGKFRVFYDSHIRQLSDSNQSTFCKKNGNMGVNIDYLIENANKATYATLMSVNGDHFDDGIFGVNAILIFRWAKTPDALKIQVLCADQRVKGTGDGTKLLNLVKQTLTSMNLNNIYLNPLEVAVPYYTKNQFKNSMNPDKLIHDSSDSSRSKTKSKSKSKSNSKSKTIAKPIKPAVIPSMTMNLRARRNWNKTKTKFKAMSVIRENINKPKTHSKSKSPSKSHSKSKSKSPKSERSTLLLQKVDEIVNGLRDRDMATFNDILDLVKRELRNITEKDEDLIQDYVYKKYNIENY